VQVAVKTSINTQNRRRNWKLTAGGVGGALASGDVGKTSLIVTARHHLVLLALLKRDVGVTTIVVATVVATGGGGNGEAGEDEDSERLDGNHFDCWKVLVGWFMER
jgi:hypothetical protein